MRVRVRRWSSKYVSFLGLEFSTDHGVVLVYYISRDNFNDYHHIKFRSIIWDKNIKSVYF